MNFNFTENDEEFNSSEAWLAENIFSQLKDFNSVLNVYEDENILLEGSTSQAGDNGNANDEKGDEEPMANFIETEYIDGGTKIADICQDVLDFSQASTSDCAAGILYGTIVNNELKPLEVLEEQQQPKSDQQLEQYITNAPPEYLNSEVLLQNNSDAHEANNIQSLYPIVKCANCDLIFDPISFQSHICDYDESHNLIVHAQMDSKSASYSSPKIQQEQLHVEPACIRLLRENQIRIRRFLKEELKYDVNAIVAAEASGGSASGGRTCSNTKKLNGPHECTLCERKFVHASGLLRHMEKHALDLIPSAGQLAKGAQSASPGNYSQSVNGLRVVIKCTLCGRIFFDVKCSFKHLCSHFPGNKDEEQEFDNSAEIPYESYVDDAMHFLNIEASGGDSSLQQEEKSTVYLKISILSCILQCEFCDFLFADVSYLFVHSACHLPYRRFECFSCEIHVRSSKEIFLHWQAECVFTRENLKLHQATIQRYFVCNVCENKFQSMEQLHEHRYSAYHFFPRVNKAVGVLQLPCEYCDIVSESAHEAVTHYEDKHYRRNKKEKDGATSSSRYRQFLCDICGKSYTQSSHLWQHLRFHKGVKPFACKEPGCTRKFTIRPDLNDHIRKCHTGERPYHCLVCGKRFLTGSVFYQHRLIHRGDRRYECDECGKRFYRADALKNHLRIHTGEKPFGCLFCTKSFRQRGDRDKHMRARHSNLDANARLMMQMRKLQQEAADAAAEQLRLNPTASSTGSYEQQPFDDVLMLGNIPFPRSMFQAMIPNIDTPKYD